VPAADHHHPSPGETQSRGVRRVGVHLSIVTHPGQTGVGTDHWPD
jgi:hypothetical protein